MQCQTCGLTLDPQQVAQTGRCPRCGTPVAPGAFGASPGGSGTYGQVPTYGQSPTAGGPPPQDTFSTIPPPPPPQGWGGPPPQGFGGPPPQPGYSPPQGPGGPPAGYGAPPPGGYGAPPKKSNTGLIVIISVIVLIVLVGGAVGAIALLGKKSPGGSTSSATNTPALPTTPPTASVPTGFTQFSTTDFSIDYPSDWMKSASTGGGSGETFSSSTGAVFEVGTTPGGGASPTQFDDLYCSTIGMKTAGPTSVTIGGQQWTQEKCQDSSGVLVSIVESVDHNNTLFLIAYASPTLAFDSDQSQYFTPMEQSFRFLI